MSANDFESELGKRFELAAEGYWVGGLSLTDARRKAVQALLQERDDLKQARQVWTKPVLEELQPGTPPYEAAKIALPSATKAG